MGAALVLLLVGLGALAAGVLIGRYYVPDDRQLRRTARHSRSYMRALSHLIARDHETCVRELRAVVEENVDDTEPYFALGAMFRSRGEHERAIRVHQALALRERDKRKLRQRAMYELGLDFRAAGMPRRATRALEEVVLEEPNHDGALRALAALYEEQARFNEAAGLWQRLGRRRGEDTSHREHHLLVAAAQAALGRGDVDSAKQLLKQAQKHEESAHFFAAAAELAAARGNHRGAQQRLKQALVADVGLAPHLLPGLIAAEQGLAAEDGPREPSAPGGEFDEIDAVAELAAETPRLATASPPQLVAARPTELAVASPTELAAASPAPRPDPAKPAVAAESVPAVAARPSETIESVPDLGEPLEGAAARSAAEALERTAVTAPNPGIALVPPPRAASSAAPVIVQLTADAAIPVVRSAVAGVLGVLAEVEAQTGPRLELALIRAQLIPPADAAARGELAHQLTAQWPGSLAARVATARLALASAELGVVRGALAALVDDDGAVAWALRGRWQCANCGHRPGPFSWRCGQCRRWNTLRTETGIDPPASPVRERRALARTARPEALLGASPDEALPAATLDPGLSEGELATAGTRRSLLGRVGSWVSGALGRDAS